jgi:hypothetical protein
MDFLIGQRVIYSHNEIVEVIDVPRGREAAFWSYQWIKRANGVEQCVSKDNLKSLPNGQM